MAKSRKKEISLLYIVIKDSTKEAFVYKEITPLSEKIGVDRATIYRKFKKDPVSWSKNGYTVYKSYDNNLKSRRGK